MVVLYWETSPKMIAYQLYISFHLHEQAYQWNSYEVKRDSLKISMASS